MELIVVGPQGWKEDVDDALDGSHGRARTLGYLPRDELDALYAEAVAVVYPSLAEGFGLPVLEAMANGAAVVTSAGTATEEVAGDAAILVDPLDVGAIARAMQRLIDDRAPRRRARRGGEGPSVDLHVGTDGRARGRGVRGSSRGSAMSRPRAGRIRVGVNLLWLLPGAAGGAERYAVRLLRALADEASDDVEGHHPLQPPLPARPR
jgi:hypothetical protein